MTPPPIATLLLSALLLGGCDGSLYPDAGPEPAPDASDGSAPWEDAAPPPDASWGLLDGAAADAGVDGGLPPDAGTDSGPGPDAGIDGGSDAGGLPPDAGTDSGPPPVPDAGSDAGPIPVPDAGTDSGPPPVDAGTDSGPPDSGPAPCLPDLFEPNNREEDAYAMASVTAESWAATVEPTWHPAPPLGDVDWYRIPVRRVTGRPTRARAWTQPFAPGWVRVRYHCGGLPVRCAGVCGESGRPACSADCEAVGLGSAEVTADCPARDGAHWVTVEVTPSRLDQCAYRVDFSVGPG